MEIKDAMSAPLTRPLRKTQFKQEKVQHRPRAILCSALLALLATERLTKMELGVIRFVTERKGTGQTFKQWIWKDSGLSESRSAKPPYFETITGFNVSFGWLYAARSLRVG
jgi:hypothetical protein